MLPTRHLALRYITTFECLGGNCEDTCCRGWEITLDQDGHGRLVRAMSLTPAGRAELARAVELRPEEARTPESYARMQLGDDEQCAMLDGEGWCSLHRRWGTRVLPALCDQFPRTVSRSAHWMTMAGELSCPEVGRRALLDPRGTDLVEVGYEDVVRAQLTYRHDDKEHDPYLTYIEYVRSAMYRLMSRIEHSVGTRLWAAGLLAARLGLFFYRGTQSFKRETLLKTLDLIESPEALDESAADRRAQAPRDGVQQALRVLAARLEYAGTPLFRALAAAGLDSYGKAIAHLGPSDAPFTDSLDEIAAGYRARRATLWAAPRLEGYLSSYLRHFWMRYTYAPSTTLLAHMQALAMRVALMRFLYISNPLLNERPATRDEEVRLAGMVAVQVSYLTSRAVDHNRRFQLGGCEPLPLPKTIDELAPLLLVD